MLPCVSRLDTCNAAECWGAGRVGGGGGGGAKYRKSVEHCGLSVSESDLNYASMCW